MKLTTILRLFGCAAAASLLSCGNGSDCIFGSKDNYVIGISQCSEDSWRQKLKEELEMATYSDRQSCGVRDRSSDRVSEPARPALG